MTETPQSRLRLAVLRSILTLTPRRFRDGYRDELLDLLAPRLAKRTDFLREVFGLLKELPLFWLQELSQRRKQRLPRWRLSVREDLRHGLRGLRRAPGFAASVILTLAAGLAAATAVFTFVDQILLRPLDYPESERLVVLCERHAERPDSWCGSAPGNFFDWKRAATTLETSGLARGWSFGLHSEGGEYQALRGGVATAGLFETFGTPLALGRPFLEDDHREGGDRVVVLSHGLWTGRFGSDPSVLGRFVELDGAAHEIVGVLEAGFEVPTLEGVEAWIPLWSERVAWRDWRGLRAFARLSEGASLLAARTELEGIGRELAQRFPETNEGWQTGVETLHQRITGSVQRPLWVFIGAVVLLLLTACANAASLLLARATVLESELALRRALGATRRRLVQYLLLQSLLLSLLGAAVGLPLAWAAVRIFVHLAPPELPRLKEVELDARLVLAAFSISLLTTLLSGLLPAILSSGRRLRDRLTQASSRRRVRVRHGLVVAQVAMAVALLVGAGLLLRSLFHLGSWQPGFDTETLLTFSVFPPPARYAEPERLTAFYRSVDEELSAVPGVESVGTVSAGPLFGGGDGLSDFHVAGRDSSESSARSTVAWFDCDPGYFETLGTPIVRGRGFASSDTRAAPKVAVIDETMARLHWPADDPIGDRVYVEAVKTWFEVVGVVAATPGFDARQPVEPKIYWPIEQMVRGFTYVVVRTQSDPLALSSALNDRLSRLEPELQVGRLQTLDQHVERALVEPRFQASLLSGFSLLAFLVAATGLYGALSYSVAQRTRELGIRMAVGAGRRQLILLVLRSGAALVASGLLIGLILALGFSRLIESLLVGVRAFDPATLLSVSTTLCAVSLLACVGPILRALSISPTSTLRGP